MQFPKQSTQGEKGGILLLLSKPMFIPYGILVSDSPRSQIKAEKGFPHTCAKYCIERELFPKAMILRVDILSDPHLTDGQEKPRWILCLNLFIPIRIHKEIRSLLP